MRISYNDLELHGIIAKLFNTALKANPTLISLNIVPLTLETTEELVRLGRLGGSLISKAWDLQYPEGVEMKIIVSENRKEIDVGLFDRAYGEGMGAKAVEHFRQTLSIDGI